MMVAEAGRLRPQDYTSLRRVMPLCYGRRENIGIC